MSHPDIIEDEVDDWALPERRQRDVAGDWREKADCCADRWRFVAEIPRTRNKGMDAGTIPPARFRLCVHHAGVLQRTDPAASIYPCSGEWGTETP